MSKHFIEGILFSIVGMVVLHMTGFLEASWGISVAGSIAVGVVLGTLWGLFFRKRKATQGS